MRVNDQTNNYWRHLLDVGVEAALETVRAKGTVTVTVDWKIVWDSWEVATLQTAGC